MAVRNEAVVTIAGKEITLSGYENPDYLYKVAAYLNGRISDCQSMDGFRRQSVEMQNLMIQLNITDDYFKAKKTADTLQTDLESKDKEIYDLKHELIANSLKLEAAQKEVEELKKDATEYQKTIIKLEAELDKK